MDGDRERQIHARGEAPLTEWFVGRLDDFPEGHREIIQVLDTEVGVFRIGGQFVAYENVCRHQGGPVCTGILIPAVQGVVEDGRLKGERFDEEELHLACPWHGVEYDIRTGICTADDRLRLRTFEVVERAGRVYVRR